MREKFSDKHPNAAINEQIRDEIVNSAQEQKLACAAAFRIAEKLNVLPAALGQTLDLMNFRMNQCQLGLFGYSPNKKIVKAEEPSSELRQAIVTTAKDDKISCASAWEIADRFHIPKTAVSNACESMNIRIKPCQLGAF